MFNFLSDMDNYDDRCVDRYDDADFMVSTAKVSDGQKPFETAICHPDYNDGVMVIVDMYDTREEAQAGHIIWLATMNKEPLPDKLIDCGNSEVSQLYDAVGGNMEYPRNIE